MIRYKKQKRQFMDQKNITCPLLGPGQIAMSHQPYPGKIGKIILSRFSRKAWELWLAEQTKLLNENRLNPLDPKDRLFLERSMCNFFKIKPDEN